MEKMIKMLDNMWDGDEKLISNVHIVDETLRDGLQFPYSSQLKTEQKIKCIEFMNKEDAISDIIIGMSGCGVENYNEIFNLLNYISFKKQVWLLSRMIIRDIQEIVILNKETHRKIGVNLFVAVSESRMLAEGWTLSEQLKKLESSLNYCAENKLSVRVAIEDFSRTSKKNVIKVLEVISKYSIDRIALADTAGILIPNSVKNSVLFVKKYLQENNISAEIEWHSHNDRGLALANSLECVNLGINFIHATVRGIGERNGNAPLELVIKNVFKENYNYDNLNGYFKYVTNMFEKSFNRLYPFFGANTNLTSTGTHTAAMCKMIQNGNEELALNLFTSTINKKEKIEDVIVLSKLTGKETYKFFLSSIMTNNVDGLINACKEYIEKNEETLTPRELLCLIKDGQIKK